MNPSKKTLAKAALRKICFQFPETPEGRLMFAIFEQTIMDLFIREHNNSAMVHLYGNIPEASLCGVDPGWIRSVLIKMGVCEFEKLKRVNNTRNLKVF